MSSPPIKAFLGAIVGVVASMLSIFVAKMLFFLGAFIGIGYFYNEYPKASGMAYMLLSLILIFGSGILLNIKITRRLAFSHRILSFALYVILSIAVGVFVLNIPEKGFNILNPGTGW